jgi:hypothetical protein
MAADLYLREVDVLRFEVRALRCLCGFGASWLLDVWAGRMCLRVCCTPGSLLKTLHTSDMTSPQPSVCYAMTNSSCAGLALASAMLLHVAPASVPLTVIFLLPCLPMSAACCSCP